MRKQYYKRARIFENFFFFGENGHCYAETGQVEGLMKISAFAERKATKRNWDQSMDRKGGKKTSGGRRKTQKKRNGKAPLPPETEEGKLGRVKFHA